MTLTAKCQWKNVNKEQTVNNLTQGDFQLVAHTESLCSTF